MKKVYAVLVAYGLVWMLAELTDGIGFLRDASDWERRRQAE